MGEKRVYKYPVTDHLRLDKIIIERKNGLPVERVKREFLSVADADAYLRKQAIYAPALEGAVDEYIYTLCFSDGQCFDSQIDLIHDFTLTGISIASAMRFTCEAASGIERKLGLTRTDYEKLIQDRLRPEDRAQYAQWLNVYVPVVESDCQPLKMIERTFANYAGAIKSE